MNISPEVQGILYHATRHQKLGVRIDWQGKKRVKNRKHAEKSQKLWAKAARIYRKQKVSL